MHTEMNHRLDEAQLSALKECQVVLEQSIPGKRKISASFLTPSPSSSASSSTSRVPSDASSSIRIQQAVDSANSTIDLPEALESIEGLEFVG